MVRLLGPAAAVMNMPSCATAKDPMCRQRLGPAPVRPLQRMPQARGMAVRSQAGDGLDDIFLTRVQRDIKKCAKREPFGERLQFAESLGELQELMQVPEDVERCAMLLKRADRRDHPTVALAVRKLFEAASHRYGSLMAWCVWHNHAMVCSDAAPLFDAVIAVPEQQRLELAQLTQELCQPDDTALSRGLVYAQVAAVSPDRRQEVLRVALQKKVLDAYQVMGILTALTKKGPNTVEYFRQAAQHVFERNRTGALHEHKREQSLLELMLDWHQLHAGAAQRVLQGIKGVPLPHFLSSEFRVLCAVAMVEPAALKSLVPKKGVQP